MRFLSLDLIVSYFETEYLIFIETKIERRAVFEDLDFVGKNKFVRMKNT